MFERDVRKLKVVGTVGQEATAGQLGIPNVDPSREYVCLYLNACTSKERQMISITCGGYDGFQNDLFPASKYIFTLAM